MIEYPSSLSISLSTPISNFAINIEGGQVDLARKILRKLIKDTLENENKDFKVTMTVGNNTDKIFTIHCPVIVNDFDDSYQRYECQLLFLIHETLASETLAIEKLND